MLRALPAIVLTAASKLAALRSSILVLAISSNWATVYGADFFRVRAAAAALNADSFLQQDGGWRCFGDESETFVTVNGNDDRQRQAFFDILGLGIESLAELHDVDTALTQGWADGRAGIRLARLYL